MNRFFVCVWALSVCLLLLPGCQNGGAVDSSAAETSQTEGSHTMNSTTTVSVTDAGESTVTSGTASTATSGTTTSTSGTTRKTSATAAVKPMTYLTSTSPNGVTVRAPKDENLQVVDAATFGMSPANKDNADAFMTALAYASAFPNSKIVIPKGVYRFSPSRALVLKDATNVVID